MSRACSKKKICEIHSRFRPEDLKGRKHLGKKCLDKRITQKWILKKYRSGYTPDLYRSGNGPTMGGSTCGKDVGRRWKKNIVRLQIRLLQKGCVERRCVVDSTQLLYSRFLYSQKRGGILQGLLYSLTAYRQINGAFFFKSGTTTVFEILSHSSVIYHPTTQHGS